MLKKRVVSGSGVFLIAASVLFSAVASRKARVQTEDPPLIPQTVVLIINEYLADPAGSAPGDLAGDANGDGIRDSADDEFVEIVNASPAPLNVGLFTISDAAQTRFTIPAGKIIPAGEAAVVFGGGTPTGAFGNAQANGLVFTAGSGGLSLNNGGDTVTVKDNTGLTVATLTFGSAEGGANQSITRSPDITGSFVTHSSAPGSAGTLFSPGGRVNGVPFTTTDPVISSISPEGSIAGDDPVTMTVTGMNFVGTSSVRLDGTAVPTSFSNATELVAEIPLSITTSAGTYLITVQNPSGALSNAVQFIVLGKIGFNEYLADPPDGLQGDANGDGVRDSAEDEFIEIVNRTGSPVDIGGFTIRDADAQRFVFPSGSIIPAGEAALIFGGGNPKGDFGNARTNGLLFTASLSLNNTGDTIALRNASSDTLESITYGSTDGSANQSINRNPDVSGVAFATHSTIPGSGGRLFSPGRLVDGSPLTVGPRIASIDPDNAKRDAAPFDMHVLGSGFAGDSSVSLDGQLVSSSFVASDHLIARVPSSVTAVSGPHAVQVRNEGGNRSNLINLSIIPPPPTLTSITPRVVIVGGSAFTMFLSGMNFVAGAAVLIDGNAVSTTVVSAIDLKATVPSSFITTLGTRAVTVRNADGKQSNSAALEVIPPLTVITSIAPLSATAGGPGFELLVRGINFKTNATVFLDGAELATTFKSQSELAAQVPATAISRPGTHSVSIRNADEFPSNDVVFQVLPDPPLLGSIDPPDVIAGSGAVTLTLEGQKFQPGAVVRIMESKDRGSALDTTFLSGERLQTKIPAERTQTPGDLALGVENPDLGLSNIITFRVLIKDPLVINEYLADPAESLAGDANGDGTRSSSSDEFIELLNRSEEPFDLSGYKLSDAETLRHVFAAGTIVPPFEAVVVFGGGTPAGSFGNAADNHLVFKASTGGLSLNNGGDTITLQDIHGRVVQQIKFGASEGGAGQSINRDPDGDGATFTLHTIVAADGNRLFSPGARASGQTFTIKPIISTITPATVRVGSVQFALTVSGSSFLPGAVVLLDNTTLPTAFSSDTRLEAQVAAELVVEGGVVVVRVKNPRGELSGAARLLIADDPPRILRITPQSTGTGAENLEVSVSGEHFQRGAAAQVSGHAVETRFESPTSLSVIVPSPLLARADDLSLVVHNADGNQSNALTLTVENGPLITRLSRSKIRAGSGGFELTVGGVAFKPSVVLFANDIALSTNYIDEVSFTARIPEGMTNQPGTLTLQARNPDGGRSNTVKLKVR